MRNVEDTLRQILLLADMERDSQGTGDKDYQWLEGKIIPSSIEEADAVELARLYQMDKDIQLIIENTYRELVELGGSLQEIAETLLIHIDLHKEMLETCAENLELVAEAFEERGGCDEF